MYMEKIAPGGALDLSLEELEAIEAPDDWVFVVGVLVGIAIGLAIVAT